MKCLQCEVELDEESAMLEQKSIGSLSIRNEMIWFGLARLSKYYWPCRNPSAFWPSLAMTASIAGCHNPGSHSNGRSQGFLRIINRSADREIFEAHLESRGCSQMYSQ